MTDSAMMARLKAVFKSEGLRKRTKGCSLLALSRILPILLVAGLGPAPSAAQGGAALVSLPVTSGHRGDRVEVSVDLGDLASRPVAAAEIEVRFDAAVLALEGVVTEGTLSQDWLVEYKIRPEGATRVVHVGLSGIESAVADGAFFRLAFRVDDEAPFGAFSALEVVSAALEQPPVGDRLPVQRLSGTFRVGAPPVVWTNRGLTVDEGGSKSVATSELEVRDVDNEPAELVYRLETVPAVGNLFGSQGPLGQGNTFTQEEVDQGAVLYIHDGSETTGDAFAFVATDGNGEGLEGAFAIRVNPVNDRPELDPVGDLQANEGEIFELGVAAIDPDGTPLLSASGLPPFATFTDHGDGTGTLRLTPDFARAGVYADIGLVATDATDASLTDGETITITVIDVNRLPQALAGEEIEVPYTILGATPVTLDGTGSSDPDGDALSYRWLENDAQIATGPAPTVALALGNHTLILIVNDGALDSVPDQVEVRVVDTTRPVLALEGDNPLYLELDTPYEEPGAAAQDEVDGDLGAAVSAEGAVDEEVEGTYSVSYQVSDARGNAALPLVRTVHVVVTPNSYALIATNSMDIRARARVHDGFVGVVDFGETPLVGGRAELVVGTRTTTAEGVRVSAPRVRLKNRAIVAGTLIYTEQVFSARNVTIGEQQQVGPEYWPLFDDFGLPTFLSEAPGTRQIDVRRNQTVTLLSFNSIGAVRVRARATLILAGGEYSFSSLDIDSNASVVVQAPTVLRIAGAFSLGSGAYFGPEEGLVDPADIAVYVNGTQRRGSGGGDDDDDDDVEVRLTADVGASARFAGNLYAPNGTLHLRSRSESVGSFIARDLIVGTNAEVSLRSGWRTSGVQYRPPPLAATKPVARLPEPAIPEEGARLASFPNPFNPSTTLHYALPDFGPVQLTIYSALGQPVRVLVDRSQPAGRYRAAWDGRNESGRPVASGMYLAHLRGTGFQQVQKLLLMK